jgi:hypothetical protein
MGYVNNKFGTLKSAELSGSFVIITNTDGESRKMSRTKYQESADEVYSRAQSLIGEQVSIRTSQNTANWNSDEWFSDIFLS